MNPRNSVLLVRSFPFQGVKRIDPMPSPDMGSFTIFSRQTAVNSVQPLLEPEFGRFQAFPCEFTVRLTSSFPILPPLLALATLPGPVFSNRVLSSFFPLLVICVVNFMRVYFEIRCNSAPSSATSEEVPLSLFLSPPFSYLKYYL